MAQTELLHPALLRQLLRYEPETGRLFWLPRSPDMYAGLDRKQPPEYLCRRFNSMFAGKEAFTPSNRRGYKIGSIFNNSMMAHRVIWALVTGSWPKVEIDHIDGNPSNNCLANLREATRSQNMMNRPGFIGKTSRYKGVHFSSTTGKWRATIRARGKLTHLGSFPTELEAAAAYTDASKTIHGEYAVCVSRPSGIEEVRK